MAFSINPHLDTSLLKETYLKERAIVIKDFLTVDSAETVHSYLNSLPFDRWSVSIHPYQSNAYTFDNNKENHTFVQTGISSATQALLRGEFSYYFYRTESDDPNCPLKKCTEFLRSKPVLDFINSVAPDGKEVSSTISLFGSCYTSRCFLTTHTDTGRGKIAFVYNLTKDWRPQYGGNLTFLDWDFKTVNRIINPTFNSLTIFNVEGSGVPHAVLPVHELVNRRRLAITGWFA